MQNLNLLNNSDKDQSIGLGYIQKAAVVESCFH